MCYLALAAGCPTPSHQFHAAVENPLRPEIKFSRKR